MPIIFHQHIRAKGELGIWQVEEPEEYFLDLLVPEEEELLIIEHKHPKKRIEWLSSRLLLHSMSGRKIRGKCLKDEYGKPYLENSEYHISMSHSGEWAAVIASPELVGVDVQVIVERITRIQHKFVREDEVHFLDDNHLEMLHVIWGAKESLYKCYGKKALNYKKHLFLKKKTTTVSSTEIRGYVVKNNYKKAFDVNYKKIENYILVWTIERKLDDFDEQQLSLEI